MISTSASDVTNNFGAYKRKKIWYKG